MLTSDLVRARRKGDQLVLSGLGPRNRPVAELVAGELIRVATASVGLTQAEWDEARGRLEIPARARKIADGLVKLVEDRCVFAMDEGADPVALREAIFVLSSARRAALPPGEPFDRAAVLSEAGALFDIDGATAEARMYADLKASWRLTAFEPLDADELVALYETGQGQAVLLRATRVTVVLHRPEPAALRAFFRKLKFLRLLHAIDKDKRGATRVELDGPASLFSSSTKYGLQLALLLPALRRCGPWELDAEILWGPAREWCRFQLEGTGSGGGAGDDTSLPDEVLTLLDRLNDAKSDWTFSVNDTVLDLPGVGLCVPDLVGKRGRAKVYVEVMGYWSRPAVWKRVELVERGLPHKIVFCVSSRLRVGEAALGDEQPGSLYVYKGVLSAKQVLDRVEALTAR